MFKTIIFTLITTLNAYGSELHFPHWEYKIPTVEIKILDPNLIPQITINLQSVKPYTPKPEKPEYKTRTWGDPSER